MGRLTYPGSPTSFARGRGGTPFLIPRKGEAMDVFWYVVAGEAFIAFVILLLTVETVAKARINADKEYRLARFEYMKGQENR